MSSGARYHLEQVYAMLVWPDLSIFALPKSCARVVSVVVHSTDTSTHNQSSDPRGRVHEDVVRLEIAVANP